MTSADRLAFFDEFASSEILIALEDEAAGNITPTVFQTSEGDFALGFKGEDSLADFTGGGPYAALPGRVIAALLADAGVGLCVEPDGDAQLLTPEDLEWLTSALTQKLPHARLDVGRIAPCAQIPERLIQLLQKRADAASELVEALVIAGFDDGSGPQNLIALIGAREEAQGDLAAAVQEALIFADAGPGWSIAFAPLGSTMAGQLTRVGKILIPEPPQEVVRKPPPPPGSDPDKPPILR